MAALSYCDLFNCIWSERNTESTAYQLIFQNFKIDSVTPNRVDQIIESEKMI